MLGGGVKMHAVKSESGQKGEMKHILQTPESGVGSIMDLGRLLLDASREGATSRVYELMLKGAPFTTDWLGTTPLHFAAKNNHYDTCQVLLRGGLSKDARTKVDRTPLHLAVFEENIEIVELLLQHKCDPNARDMLKMTALHWAVEKENEKLVELLLKNGADSTIESKFGKTPVTMAVQKGNSVLVNMLLDPEYSQEMIRQTEKATKSIRAELFPHQDDLIDDSDIVIDEEGNIMSPKGSPSHDTDDLIEEDDGISVSDMMNQIEDPASPGIDSIGLKVLKEHGIQMLPQDDTNIFQNALNSGCTLKLSEAGKLVLRNASKLQNTFANFTSPSTSITPIISRKRSNLVSPITSPVTHKKIIKLQQNFRPSNEKRRKSDEINLTKLYTKTLDKLPQETSVTIATGNDENNATNERIADVQELDEFDEDFLDQGTPDNDNRISKLEQQLLEMKRETERLRRDLEKSHKQNEMYRLRIEKLENAVFGSRSKEKS